MIDELVRTLPDRLRATPAEVAGLGVLLAGVVAVTAVVWWTSGARAGGPFGDAAPAVADPPAAAVPTGTVTVHVSGAVVQPGVLALPDGARVTDAVAAAGGLTLDADPGRLNLARTLEDGEQVVVPTLAGDATGDGAPAGPGARAGDGRIDLNRATASELEELPGVGPVLAGRIVAWRDDHGRFREVGELREVSGIGEKVFQSLVDLVVVR